ncbi:MAG TPA: SurA N-terminal domain-containing protein [Candidatus Limiplasma stercoravium]|nr:SurA N-terminal domain-containing protein [Candidatus Limiplasma stercoravium]
MTKKQKLVSLLLCACMLLGTSALAQTTELASDTLLATVGEDSITWADIQNSYNGYVASYGAYYDMTQQSNIDLFRAVALDNIVTETVMMQKAKEFGLDQLTEEEIASAQATADADWDSALQSYLSYYYSDMTSDAPQEERTAALAEAEAYYNDAGYSLEILRTNYVRYAIFNKVEQMMLQDVVVTDEDV